MSKTIDSRVVELQFDNKQFESATATSMSTLDKLKQKLNFTGAAKGFESVSAAAKKVDMAGLGSAVDSVKVKFSALQVMGVTALSNITNSAINAGKNIVSAFTLDPIMTGFQEYETQINAIQTILANTQSKGTTLTDVTAALDELNTYADQTIYNFTEMTRNIGTFTAAGVGLEESVNAIKGIANLAAISGSNATQASTAMYQLSQALAAGRVSLMDWNSVVNAGMGGELFQNALKRTAENMGHNVDALIEKYGSFRESLTKGQWLTSEVLTETLAQLSGAYTEADLIAQGYSKSQAKSIVELANTAVSAATDVKTFTQLWDTLKESAQSGWTNTWELIIGDFEEAKTNLTGLSEVFGDFIQGSADARNAVVEGAMSSKWDQLTAQVNEAGVATEDFQNAIIETAKKQGIAVDDIIKKSGSLSKAFQDGSLSSQLIIDTLKNMAGATKEGGAATEDMTAKLEKFQKVVDQVWHGDFKNGEERIKALTDAGYDYAEVQDLVNKTVDGHKLKLEDLNDAQLKNVGYTDEEIKKLRELAEQAEKTGTPLNELINDISKPSGRELLWEGVVNVVKSFIGVLKSLGSAWDDVFGVSSDQLYGWIEGFNRFSKAILMSEDTLDKLSRTFRGIFGVIHIFTSLITGGLSLGLQTLTLILENFDLSLLDVTAAIGDALYAFSEWVTSGGLLKTAISGLISVFKSASNPIGNFFKSFSQIDIIQDALSVVSNFFDSVKEYVNGLLTLSPGEAINKVFNDVKNAFMNLKETLSNLTWQDVLNALSRFGENVRSTFKKLVDGFKEIGPDIIEGLQNGLKDGFDGAIDFMKELAQKLIEAVKAILGIHSPSTVFFEIGKNIIDGLCEGIKYVSHKVTEALSAVIDDIKGMMEGVNWGAVIGIGAGIGSFVILYQLTDALQTFATGFSSFSAPLKSASGVLDSFKQTINGFNDKMFGTNTSSKGFKNLAEGIKILAEAIAILAGSVAVLTMLDTGKMWGAVGAIGTLAIIVGVLSVALSRFAAGDSLKKATSINTTLLSLAGSLLILSLALKQISGISSDGMVGNLLILVGMAAGMVAAMAALNKLAPQLSTSARTILAFAASLKIIVSALEDLNDVNVSGISSKLFPLIAVVGTLGLLMAAASNLKVGGFSALTILGAVVGLKLLVGSLEDIAKLDASAITSNLGAFVTIFGTFATLMAASRLAGANAAKAGVGILAMSAALILIVQAIKMLADVDTGDISNAQRAVTQILVVFGLIVALSNFAGQHAIKAGVMLAIMSMAMMALVGVMALMTQLDPAGLDRALEAVIKLELVFGALIAVSKLASSAEKTMISLTVAVGILAAALAGLSFVDPSGLQNATIALSAVMAMFSLMTASTKFVQKATPTLITMTVAVGLLAGVLAALSLLPNPEGLVPIASALAILMTSLAASMRIISTVKTVSLEAFGALAGMELALAGIGVILGLMQAWNIQPSIETAASLSLLLLSLSAACVILAGVGTTAPAALAGALALDGVILIIGGLMAAIGALVTYFPALEQFVNKGIGLLEAIGRGIGSFVGGIVGGFAEGVTSGLPGIAENLSEFITNLQPFIDGITTIDATAVDGMKNLAQMLLMLTGASFLDGLTRIITGGSSLATFGAQLVPFGNSMKQYAESISGLNVDAIEASAAAGKILTELANTVPNTGGLAALFAGDNTLFSFGLQLVPFGLGMKAYSLAVAGMDTAAVENSAIAGKALTELAQTVPNAGGLLSMIVGDNTLGSFGLSLIPFGAGMKEYSLAVAGIDVNAVQNSVTAGQALTALAQTVPNAGGLLAFLSGDNTLSSFGLQLVPFGLGMKAYSIAVAGIDAAAVENSVTVGQALVALAQTVPNTGGLISFFTGQENNLATFGTQLVVFGGALAAYSWAVAGIDPDAITTSASASQALVTLADSVSALEKGGWFSDATTLGDFGSQLKKFGDAMSDFYSSISGIDAGTLSSTITQVSRLVNMLSSMSGVNFDGASGFKNALKTLAETSINDFVNAFSNASSRVTEAVNGMMNSFVNAVNSKGGEIKNAFDKTMSDSLQAITSKQTEIVSAAETIMSQFSNAITTNASTVVTAFNTMMSQAVNAVRAKYSDFSSAGGYIVQGLANGIRNNMSTAVAQARAMAQAVEQASKTSLGVQSPSKVFTEIGKYVVQGLVNGIANRIPTAEKVTKSLGRALVRTFDSELGINSPSVVMIEKGHYVVQGLAEGIEADTSAEEAMKQKAQNIVDAFQTEIDALSSSLNTSSLENQLWESLNPNATEAEKSAKEMEFLQKKLESQTETVRLTQGKYQSMVDNFGASSEEAQNAYDEVLQAQIDLADIVNEINSLQDEIVESNREKMDKYSETFNNIRDSMTQMGYTLDAIRQAAADMTGYDMDALLASSQPLDVKKIVNDAVTDIQVAYQDAAAAVQAPLENTSTQIGNTMATALSDSIEKETPKVAENAAGMATTCADKIEEHKDTWKEGSTILVDAFIVGIEENVNRAAAAAAQMAIQAYQAAMSAIEANSESTMSNMTSTLEESVSNSVSSGISKGASSSSSKKTTSAVAKTAASGIATVVSTIANVVNNGIDSEPVIKPVLDLSDVKSGISKLNTMVTRSKASSINTAMNGSKITNSQNGSDSSGSGSSQTFIQNNYSPKSLSSVEIYRQTKNLFSTSGKKVKT